MKEAEFVLDSAQLSEETLHDFAVTIAKMQSLTGTPVFAGGWLNAEDGKYYLDATLVIEDQAEALSLQRQRINPLSLIWRRLMSSTLKKGSPLSKQGAFLTIPPGSSVEQIKQNLRKTLPTAGFKVQHPKTKKS